MYAPADACIFIAPPAQHAYACSYLLLAPYATTHALHTALLAWRVS
jgi:hypothetical protein